MDQSKGKQERNYQQSSPSTHVGMKKMPTQGGKSDLSSGGYDGFYQQMGPGMTELLPYNGHLAPSGPPHGFGQMMPTQTGFDPFMPGQGFQNAPMPSMPQTGTGMPQPGMGMPQQTMPFPPQVPSGGPMFPTTPSQIPRERSYIENILRLNRGKRVTAYFTFENNDQWNAKKFTGILQEAGKDHLVLADPQTGKWYLLLMIYLDYVEFDEQIEYEYPFG